MKTLYIPTSTLNFNNILSSESISPKGFYESRDFGYSRWTLIPENNFQNAITLYDYQAGFKRPESDLEDHPMLIEVELDEEKVKPLKDGIYFSDRTIYLNPTTTRFLFFSENDKLVTLSMSESSLESKMMKLYKKCYVCQKILENLYPITEQEEPCELNMGEIENDKKINKMKGLLYGYYIGALLSTSAENISQLNTVREIHNIFAATLSSFDKRPTSYQNERLDELFIKVNENINPKIRSLISANNDKQKIMKWFQETSWNPNELYRKERFLSFLQLREENNDAENPAISWIKDEIQKTQAKISKEQKPLSVDNEEMIITDKGLSKCTIISDETEQKLMLAWCNEILIGDDVNGNISTYKVDLADRLTRKAKEIIGNGTWENHSVRKYLNDLRHHIAGEEFGQRWSNGLLSSIAAVLLRGEDWDNLLRFMQSENMIDYRLAFAFYGIINGFSNLGRDFTDVLYDYPVKSYVWKVYKEFHGQLHGESLTVNKTKTSKDIRDKAPNEKNDSNMGDEVASSKPEVPTPQPTEAVQCNQEVEHNGTPIPVELKAVFESRDFKKMTKPAQEYYKNKAIRLLDNYSVINPSYIEALKKLDYTNNKKSKDYWLNAIKILSCEQTNSDDLFSSTNDRNQLSSKITSRYSREVFFLKSLKTLENVPNTVFERLVDNFGYASQEKNKEEHLKYFSNLCINEGRGHKNDGSRIEDKGLFGYYTEEINTKLIDEIKKKYDDYKK